MSYTIKHNPLLDIIELTYSGPTTGTDLKESTSECISLGNQIGTIRFLIDTTGMNLAASLVDIFELPAEQYVD